MALSAVVLLGLSVSTVQWAGASPRTTSEAQAVCTPSFTRFEFSPGSVTEGSASTLVATVKNCSRSTFTGSLETFGLLVCVVADPVTRPIHVRPRRSTRYTMTYTTPDCSGTGTITGRLLGVGGTVESTGQATIEVSAP